MDFPFLPRSSDSKLDGNDIDGNVEGGLNRKRRSKAKSMEALNHQNKDNGGGGGSNKRWGSGIWSWLTRSRERMDSAESGKNKAGDTEDEEVAGGTTTEEEKGGGGIKSDE